MLKSGTYIPHILLPVLCLLCSLTVAGKDKEVAGFTQQSSLVFIENKGQITDQHGAQRTDIDFKLETPAVNMFIGKGHMHYQWRKENQKEKVKTDKSDIENQPSNPDSYRDQHPISNIETYRLDVTLLGANPNAQLITADADPYYENYYLPHLGENGAIAKSYRKIIYKNIYPNIDWVIYTNASPPEAERPEGAKYDFIIHPGGNPKDIQVRYDGATSLQLDNGNITAITPFGSITENAPYTYNAETKEQIASSFVLNGNILSFNLAPYNGTIVIDPQLHWATYYGGSGVEYAASVCTDNDDNVYLCGHTRSANNISTTGAFQTTINSSYHNAFLVKFTSLGKRLWGTYYSNGSNTTIHSSVFDNAPYLVGYCDSTGSSATSGTHQVTFGGGASDCLLLKFTTSGSLVWVTYFGGTGKDYCHSIVKAGNGSIYISGQTTSTGGIATSGAYQDTVSNYQFGSSFIAKFRANGTRIWGTYFGDTRHSANAAYIVATTADKWGNVYVGGYTRDTVNIATSGAHQPKLYLVNGNGYDGYLVKFDSSGKKIWGTYYGGQSNTDHISGLDCDTTGNVYCVGASASTDSIATPGSFQTSGGNMNNNIPDAFIVKFDSSGKRLWGTYYGNYSGNEELYNIKCSNTGTIFITGQISYNAANMVTSDAYRATWQGGIDVLLVQFTQNGSRVWASYFGGPDYDWSSGSDNSIAIAKNNDIYFSGQTESTTGIATANGHQFSHGGGSSFNYQNREAFLAKLTGDTVVSIDKLLPDTLCAGSSFYLNYRTTYPFKSNNVFTAQLSNSSGSFASPVTIGTKTGLSTDSLLCTIPANTPPGTAYRIRILGSLSADTSLENTHDIVINNLYPANLAATFNGPTCPYDTLKLIASTTSSGVKFLWTGPNGFTSAIANPVIDTGSKYAAGQYVLLANLYGCLGRDTVDVTFKPMPYATTYNATVITPCLADTLFLSMSNATTGTTFSWTGPNSFTSTLQNPFILQSSPVHTGQYIVTATLNGCVQKDTATLSTIKPLPANVTATSNAPICAGNNLLFNAASSSSGVTFAWSGPNSFTSTSATPFISSASPVHNGDYIASVNLNGCIVKDTVAVVINPIPAKPVANANTPVCAGDSLHFTVTTSVTGATFQWSGPGGYATAIRDSSFVSALFHTGDYYLVLSKDGCVSKDTVSVLVKHVPAPVTVSNNGPLCAGDTLKLLSGTSSTGVTYTWSGPNSFNAATQNAFIPNSQAAASGWYRLVLNLNGCLFKDSTSATVHPIPSISSKSYNSPLCIGETLSLRTGNITGASFAWTGVNNFSSALQNPTRSNIQFGDTGWYKVTATVNGCISPVDSIRVTANPLPFVVIFANKDSLCNGEPVLFTALPNNAGASPVYAWKVNAQPAGSGSSYGSSSLNNGDIVSCEMTDNTKCSAPYTDPSNDIQMKVLPWLAPSVTISANPNGPLKPYEYVSFTANVTNGGNVPTFQWKRNGQNVQGATSALWSANTLNDNDSISVEIISNYKCPQPATAKSNGIRVKILTGIQDAQTNNSILLFPNPNKGGFTLSGRLVNRSEEAVQVEVLNTLGQVLYKKELQVQKGNLDAHIQLDSVAPGTYLLRIHNSSLSEAIRFTVQ